MITTFEEAYELVLKLGICTIFEASKSGLPSLWEHVDLPEKQAGEKGWGEKISAIWDWKNRLPAEYPEEIFYGKIKGGTAALMTTDYLRDTHFPAHYQSVSELRPLCEIVFEKIRVEPWDTTALRKEIVGEYGCSKSQFETALKNLQVSLNVVRSNDLDAECDVWLPFRELYPEIWAAHILED